MLLPAPTSFLWAAQTAGVGHFDVQTHRPSSETVWRLSHDQVSGLVAEGCERSGAESRIASDEFGLKEVIAQ